MTLFKKLVLLVAITFTSHSHCASVWKVSSDTHSLYIGGTIHVLAKEDYPLPKEYDQAFKLVDQLVFETDMSVVNSPEFAQKMMGQMMFADGTTIDKILKPAAYTALKAHLDARGIPMQNFASFKPSLLAITLSMLELQILGLTSEGVDLYYSKLAAKKNKPQLWLESPDQQIEFLLKMGQSDHDAMIEYTLKDIKKMPNMIDTLRKAWRIGDMPALAEVGIKEFITDYPEIYQDLLVTRNHNWLPQIEKMLNTEPVEFVLVGALHLAGPDSVLTSLQSKGYKVEKL
ncbi:TraB/GumN family protein [Paraglaciecola aquimarina]|uniref:TraB/GumN family protein n=1 Tax=Paraglaciecola algarum TaxID=3050085 RepID=A0ABS9DCC2_9ALTE|nr:TraB/GumN family protein [Paraglaciecola sp. G1-23]MCF2949997.1 TraB/GumN family protein [Paraglaciecola sp. G1-23]